MNTKPVTVELELKAIVPIRVPFETDDEGIRLLESKELEEFLTKFEELCQSFMGEYTSVDYLTITE